MTTILVIGGLVVLFIGWGAVAPNSVPGKVVRLLRGKGHAAADNALEHDLKAQLRLAQTAATNEFEGQVGSVADFEVLVQQARNNVATLQGQERELVQRMNWHRTKMQEAEAAKDADLAAKHRRAGLEKAEELTKVRQELQEALADLKELEGQLAEDKAAVKDDAATLRKMKSEGERAVRDVERGERRAEAAQVRARIGGVSSGMARFQELKQLAQDRATAANAKARTYRELNAPGDDFDAQFRKEAVSSEAELLFLGTSQPPKALTDESGAAQG